jgi:hypothetical protein
MRIHKLLTVSTIAVMAIGLLAFNANALETISVNFGRSAHAVDGTAGAPGFEADNWNNTSSTNGSVSDLMDSAGVTTTADIEWNADEIWRQSELTQATGDLNMMASFINDTSGTTDGETPFDPNSLMIDQIPYADYTLVVYVHGEGGRKVNLDLTAGAVTANKIVNLSPNYADTRYSDFESQGSDVLVVDNGYLLDSGVDYQAPDSADPNNEGNYVIFDGLSSSSLTLEYGGLAGFTGRGSIAGLQVVEVPEPATMALLGVGGLALLRRRAKA